MSTAPPIYGQLGQALAFAERTLTSVLRAHLAERNTEPETWYALQLIATRGPGLARDDLSGALGSSPNLDADSIRALLAALHADGLIEGDAYVDLTPDGAALHRSLREYVLRPTTELLSQFELEDIETTVRTLQAITDRVNRQLTV
jgi:DNA-binding MarR family transcriptional regulator